MKNKPSIELHGENIKIRQFKEQDITSEYIAWLNNKNLMQFSNQRFYQHSHSSCLSYLDSFKGTDNYFLVIEQEKDSTPLGTITVYINSNHKTADIGILVGQEQKKGYATQAWTLLHQWLFEALEIRKITAGCLACNTPMRRVFEKCGMHHEATRSRQELLNGKPMDIVYYARFNPR